MKKILALILALTMVVGLMSVSAWAASITITTDETYEGTDQAYVYDAYKIFDAQYDTLTATWTQENKDNEDEFSYTPTGAAVAYFMATGNPWISTIQGLTQYFTVTAAADGSGYVVTPKVDVDENGEVTKNYYSTAEDALAVAKELQKALTREENPVVPTGDYAAIEITAGGSAVTVDEGYYLIVGRTAANLALVTTDVTLVEKNEYPSLIKEFEDETTTTTDIENPHSDEDTSSNDTVQIGDTISYKLTVTIPSGANQQMVIKDSFTSGLNPVLTNDTPAVVATTITGLDTTAEGTSAPTVTGVLTPVDDTTTTDVDESEGNKYFTITIDAATVTANAGKTITIVYEAVVTADAWYQTEENTGELKYGNDYNTTPDKVDSTTTSAGITKRAGSEDGDKLKGAKFELYRTDEDHTLTKAPVYVVALTDADLTAAKITKAADTVYYRVATAAEIEANNAAAEEDKVDMTTIDMTDAYTAMIYGLDEDSTYYAREIQAPTGYNILTEDKELALNTEEATSVMNNIVNNSGTVLPSTGGIGTTIFYIVGGLLAVGAGVVLVTKKRMSKEDI